MLFIHQNSVLNKRELALQAKKELMYDREEPSLASGSKESQKHRRVISISSLEEVSFVSAQDTVADLRDFDDLAELDTEKLSLYQSALDTYEASGIQYRVLRTEFLGCGSDTVLDELSSRNVKCMNLYDICLDYILIDSFEDLESPPSSVLAVMKNRWLSNSFKESALHTALWSVFQAKRRLLQFPNGFKARFYNVSEILTPTLAWAFFGPDEELGAMVNEFKEQVLGFLKDIFSFHSADYNTVESLSASVMSLARARLETIKRKLGCSDTGAGDA